MRHKQTPGISSPNTTRIKIGQRRKSVDYYHELASTTIKAGIEGPAIFVMINHRGFAFKDEASIAQKDARARQQQIGTHFQNKFPGHKVFFVGSGPSTKLQQTAEWLKGSRTTKPKP